MLHYLEIGFVVNLVLILVITIAIFPAKIMLTEEIRKHAPSFDEKLGHPSLILNTPGSFQLMSLILSGKYKTEALDESLIRACRKYARLQYIQLTLFAVFFLILILLNSLI